MELYINGVGCISPQETFDNSVFLTEIKEHSTNKIFCINPDYSKYFDVLAIRRMSRIIKFGSAAAMLALKDADVKCPGAIITGTGLGLIETSGKFLSSSIDNDEGTLSPTAFIQSTHNTISAGIALATDCHSYNNTFAHKGFSFECALIDARMFMRDTETDNVLAGAYDEISDYSFALMEKLNKYHVEPCNNLDIFSEKSDGTIGGEGAAFFILSKQKNENSYAIFSDNTILYKPKDENEVEEKIKLFLNANNLSLNDIDIVVSGISGDKKGDAVMLDLNDHFFTTQTIITFKHLCGEYATSTAFASWLITKILKTQTIPEAIVLKNRSRKPGNILLYNMFNNNHSLMLFRQCPNT